MAEPYFRVRFVGKAAVQEPVAEEQKGIRDRRKIKKAACRIVSQLIEGYLSNGNHGDWTEYDIDRLEEAFHELADELDQRGQP